MPVMDGNPHSKGLETMPNIAQVLKDETQRLARKEVRAATVPLKKDVAALKRTAADLKRRLTALEREYGQMIAVVKRGKTSSVKVADEEVGSARITAKMIKSLRSRLGISQADLAALLGVGANSVYLWEAKEGRLSFRGDTKAGIVELRNMSKAEVGKRLARM
jgi:DNA-binding transcriptional regulator YiaG